MIKGIVPDFGYDVKLAITVDQEKQDNIPESDETKDNNYYSVGVSCSNEVKGEWDYNAWNLKLNNVVEGTKCNLTFTSNLTKEEHDNIIKEGVAYRRNTYRGKDITNYYNGETINGRDLFAQIKNCTFDDIYVGDYFTTNKQAPDGTNHKVTWLIADLNNYLNVGYEENALTTCHATIIPAISLTNAKMNETNTTGVVNQALTVETVTGIKSSNVGAYMGSNMKQETLPAILRDYVLPAFTDSQSHVLEYSTFLSYRMTDTNNNQYQDNTGASSAAAWYKSQIDLMSEVNVFGTNMWSSSGFDTGIDNKQYAIFQLKPEFTTSYGESRISYWLKGVANKETFTYVHRNGSASGGRDASDVLGVRPRFLID